MQSDHDAEQCSQIALSSSHMPIRNLQNNNCERTKSPGDNIDVLLNQAAHLSSTRVSPNKPLSNSRGRKRKLLHVDLTLEAEDDARTPTSRPHHRLSADVGKGECILLSSQDRMQDGQRGETPVSVKREAHVENCHSIALGETRSKEIDPSSDTLRQTECESPPSRPEQVRSRARRRLFGVELEWHTQNDKSRSEVDIPCIELDSTEMPEEFVIPQPPSLSSEDFEEDEGMEQGSTSCRALARTPVAAEQPITQDMKKNGPERRPWVTDSHQVPEASQDSACFSYTKEAKLIESKELILQDDTGRGKSEPFEATDDSPLRARDPYYSQAFDYVLKEVVARYSDVLRPHEVHLAKSMRKELSRDGLALFVRIYRRKQPKWYSISGLRDSYGTDIDVDAGAVELFQHGYVASSIHDVNKSKERMRSTAQELLENLWQEDLKAVSAAIADSKVLKKMRKRELLPALRAVLSEEGGRAERKRKLKQMTLSGFSEADCLSRAIIKRAGYSIKIPEDVLEQLQRVHSLFFLEAGHDSSRVLLARAGKVRFPDYECRGRGRVFPSSVAFEDYEAAIMVEKNLNRAIEERDLLQVAHFGSIAEVAIIENHKDSQLVAGWAKNSSRSGASKRHSQPYSSSCSPMAGSARTLRTKNSFREDIRKQLQHPFFRRYTAQWVYVRIAWHSVRALEELGEHGGAVQRLKLLLSTGLVPKRRGACMNRLTINLYRHLGRLQEALDLILTTLEEGGTPLRLGDRLALVHRGIAIHRKLGRAYIEENLKHSLKSKSDRKRKADEAVNKSRPLILDQMLARYRAKPRFRKIYGVSMQIANRERERSSQQRRSDPWDRFRMDSSRDSIEGDQELTISVMGKSKYKSQGSSQDLSSVENYCLEWYLGKEGWSGVHDEGSSLRFLYALLFWECALFAPVEDVFQTPYQDYPLDLFTEAFYGSRREQIDERVQYISSSDPKDLRVEVEQLYEKYDSVMAIGCAWKMYTAEDLADIAAGLGGPVLSHCCRLLSVDYAYWSSGLPDLTLWKSNGFQEKETFSTRLVEVKSPRDALSEKQKAWLIELQNADADCEVCKVVERVTAKNAPELQSAALNSIEKEIIDSAGDGATTW